MIIEVYLTMSLHKDPELKEAVLNLSPREKDKLLIRLISKDKMLIKQLHFQLLEDDDDLIQRVNTLRDKLIEMLESGRSGIKNTATFSNYRALTSLLRQMSGLINEHEKITKDKFSEVEFRLLIINNAFKNYPILFQKSYIAAADKLHKYVIARLKTTLSKYDKLHEDLQFDLREYYDYVTTYAAEHDLY